MRYPLILGPGSGYIGTSEEEDYDDDYSDEESSEPKSEAANWLRKADRGN